MYNSDNDKAALGPYKKKKKGGGGKRFEGAGRRFGKLSSYQLTPMKVFPHQKRSLNRPQAQCCPRGVSHPTPPGFAPGGAPQLGNSQPKSLPGAAREAGTKNKPFLGPAPLSWGKGAHVLPNDPSTRFGHSDAPQHGGKPSKQRLPTLLSKSAFLSCHKSFIQLYLQPNYTSKH